MNKQNGQTTMKPLILVTGATGKTGFAVVEELRKRDWPVRALIHSDDVRTKKLKLLGAETFQADLFDPLQLREAMKGVKRAYFCPPWHPHMLQGAVAFAVAAHDEKLEAIVALSQWLASPTHPSLATKQNWLMEKIFSMIPEIASIVINPGFFADNYMALVPFAAQLGLFPMPTGVSQNAPPSNEDIARVAVAALLDPEKYAGQSFRPTGPELLDSIDMAKILSKVLNRKVVPIDLPLFMFFRALRVMGFPAFQQSGLRHYLKDHIMGAFEVGAPTNHVKILTGQEPESFETIARRYAQEPDARRGMGNKLKALWTFMKIGMTSPIDLDAFDRAQEHPILSQSLLAMDSEVWRANHLRR